MIFRMSELVSLQGRKRAQLEVCRALLANVKTLDQQISNIGAESMLLTMPVVSTVLASIKDTGTALTQHCTGAL